MSFIHLTTNLSDKLIVLISGTPCTLVFANTWQRLFFCFFFKVSLFVFLTLVKCVVPGYCWITHLAGELVCWNLLKCAFVLERAPLE